MIIDILTRPAALAVAIIAIIAVMLWRRIFGGWLGLRRSLLHLALFCVVVAAVWISFRRIDLAVAIGMVVMATWADGHEWTMPKFMFYRYALGPAVIGGLLAWATGRPEALCFFIAGAAVAAVYWAAQRWWPATWCVGGFIDGPIAVAELGAGLSINGGLLIAVALLKT